MRSPAWSGSPRPSWAPLALTLGLHLSLVLVLAWQARAGRPPARPPAPERAFLFIPIAPLSAPTPPRASTPAPKARQTVLPVPSVRPPTPAPLPDRTVSVSPAPEPVPPREAESNTLPDAMTADAPAPDALPEAAPPATGLPGELLASSKRMAGPADSALRQGASPITAEPDRKWVRFAEAVAGAHAGTANAVTLASHTAADGVVIYRKTIGSRVRCYRSGSVGGVGIGGFAPADGQGAGNIPCPSGAAWRRH